MLHKVFEQTDDLALLRETIALELGELPKMGNIYGRETVRQHQRLSACLYLYRSAVSEIARI